VEGRKEGKKKKEGEKRERIGDKSN